MIRLLLVGAALALFVPEPALAHGIGSVRDLPVPLWLFFYGGATVLVISFVALGVLWTKPRLDPANARPLPAPLQRILLSPALRVALGALSFALLAVVWLAAAFGDRNVSENVAPTFVYVVFWLGMLVLVVALGNVWRVLNPWKAGADALAWLWRLGGGSWTVTSYPERLGYWPAAGLLFAFAALELAYTEPADPRMLAIAILVYSWATWVGMLLFGRRAWIENGDGFSVYFDFLSRIAPFAVADRDGRRELVARAPLAGLSAREPKPGAIAVVSIMLGSVAFDGFSRTTWWQDRLFSVQEQLIFEHPSLADLATIGLNLAGLVAAVCLVAATYRTAVLAAEALAHRRVSLTDVFIGSLVPIALVYAVAHYFSLFVLQGQFAIPLASDPFGRGWDLFGTSDFQPDLSVLSPNAIWYIEVIALVTGHVFGLVIAHDRAVALVRSARAALRSQYAMLTLMVFYTVGGLWLLSRG